MGPVQDHVGAGSSVRDGTNRFDGFAMGDKAPYQFLAYQPFGDALRSVAVEPS
jgi:hypothetical protein